MARHPFSGTAPFFLLPVAVIAGRFAALAAWSAWGVVAALAGLAAIMAVMFRLPPAITATVVAAFCGAVSTGGMGFVDPGTVAPLLGRESTFRGTVESVRATDSGWSGLAEDVVVSTMDGTASIRVKRMAVFIRNPDSTVRFPVELRATGRLHPVRSAGNPCEIPREWGALASEAQFAFSADASKAILLPPAGGNAFFPSLRARTASWLSRVAGNSDGALYLQSLATGQVPPSSHPLVALFRTTGLAHLFAISGVNVVVFHAMLAAILRIATWSVRRRHGTPDLNRLSSLAALPACWGYALMAGAPIPAIRSAGMITTAVLLWNLLGGRGAGFCFSLLFFLSVSVSPLSLLTPSFMLSYTAVFFLVVSTGSSGDAGGEKGAESRFASRAARWALAAIEASATAFFGTLPISAAFFQALPVTAILWNVLFGPILGTAGVAGALLAVSGGVTGLGLIEGPTRLVADILSRCIGLLRTLSAGAAWYLPVPPCGPATMAIATLGAVAGAMGLRSKGRPAWPAPVLSALLFLCWIHLPYVAMPDARMTLAALNVPNGAAHVVFFPGGGTMVIDCGSEDRGDSGRRVLVPYLRSMGVRRVDLLVLSHPHEDHFGGAAALLESMPVGEIWVPEGVSRTDFGTAVASFAGPIVPAGKGRAYCRGGARVEVRSAGDRAVVGGNGESLVIELRYGRFSAWLPGDVEGGPAAWGAVSAGGCEKRILFLPHHGSSGADPAGWIAAAAPDVTVVKNRNCLAGENLLTSGKVFALEIGALFCRTDGRSVLVGQESSHPLWSRICRLE